MTTDNRGVRTRRKESRSSRWRQFTGYVGRRKEYVAVGIALGVVAAVLAVVAGSTGSPIRDLSLNLSADLVGTIVVLFVVGPVFDRSNRNQERVLPRLDHDDLLRQIENSKKNVTILELWTDLLEPHLERRFRRAIDTALERGSHVQILLLDPHNPAAEQRGRELGRTDVPQSIMQNVVLLHQMRKRLNDELRDRFDVRIYSSLPSAQVYQVDDHILASFFPTRVPSWDSPQYQTKPHYGLGIFLTRQFDDLWTGEQTRTMHQFRYLTLREIDTDASDGKVRFATFGDLLYVGDSTWMRERHFESGFASVRFEVIEESVLGEGAARGPFRLETVNESSDEYRAVAHVFRMKYGGEQFQGAIHRLGEAALVRPSDR